MRLISLIPVLALALPGCSAPPEAEAALGPEPAGTGYAELLPLSELLAIDTGDPASTEEADAAMAARVAALKARAAGLSSGS